jgi:hypothetical protein
LRSEDASIPRMTNRTTTQALVQKAPFSNVCPPAAEGSCRLKVGALVKAAAIPFAPAATVPISPLLAAVAPAVSLPALRRGRAGLGADPGWSPCPPAPVSHWGVRPSTSSPPASDPAFFPELRGHRGHSSLCGLLLGAIFSGPHAHGIDICRRPGVQRC